MGSGLRQVPFGKVMSSGSGLSTIRQQRKSCTYRWCPAEYGSPTTISTTKPIV
jgi:hypothetical protein